MYTMKAIQMTIDERLLAELDSDPEVQRDGRSAVMRRAAVLYLRSKRREQTREAYRRAYAGQRAADVDWIGWTDEEAWPDE
jgi:metal-responsive CopG/Arc/MetJ family transcriptional regulator